VSNYLPAGRDTTACLLSWASYEISLQPTLGARLHAECAEVDWSESTLAAEREDAASYCRRLPLLHATLMEALRLHPPVPMDVKECGIDDVWPGGQHVTAGTMVVFSPYLMGRSEKIWGPSSSIFDPDRWLDSTGQPIKEPSLYTMPVFQAGPRLCLGKSAAMVVNCMLLSRILQQYEFLAPQTDSKPQQQQHCDWQHSQLHYDVSIALPFKGGLPMQLRRRQAAADSN
jgi:cytochrome P450